MAAIVDRFYEKEQIVCCLQLDSAIVQWLRLNRVRRDNKRTTYSQETGKRKKVKVEPVEGRRHQDTHGTR